MKILLVGEYSNVHWTLSEGLRALGHKVTVASGGDAWKNYPRDIDLAHTISRRGHVSFAWRLLRALPKLRGYDIVQLINPVFFEMKARYHRPFFDYLRRYNKHVVLGAFGMDYYWAQVNREIRPMRYSDFNIGDEVRADEIAQTDANVWIGTSAERLTRYVAWQSDAIVAGLYEYWLTYNLAEDGALKEKTVFIPFPLEGEKTPGHTERLTRHLPIRIFVGISKGRSQYKGTDVMLSAARRLKQAYPDRLELRVVEGVPFDEYKRLLDGSDMILDQLYSYTPAMNALLAMGKGIICVGGGEPEHYDLLGERVLRPIINVEPNEESVYRQLEQLVLHPECIPELKRQSMEYVRKYHDVERVAKEYEKLYYKICKNDVPSR